MTLLAVTKAGGPTNKSCPNAVPGLDKMALGIDVTFFDLFSHFNNNGLKNQVLQYTCDEARTKTIDGVN